MKIIHLSDLHFGTENDAIVEDLREGITANNPDLIVISGDFTQVGSSREFEKARAFLDAFETPHLCVPGNHDIPSLDLIERFFSPYKKYERYIDDNFYPVFDDGHIIVAGINSARRMVPHWNWANGAISQKQLDELAAIYEHSNAKRRVCVFHHPIHHAINAPMNTVVFGAQRAIDAMNAMEVDLVLTGHVHHASVTTLGDIDHKTIYLSASTALSSRLRKQQNGFNMITLNGDEMVVEMMVYDGTHFIESEHYAQKLI